MSLHRATLVLCLLAFWHWDACLSQSYCTCEGYQYYDCVHAGFKDGKVPEGQSYFVDFGSTECTCPQGGGKISCQFIPCPELPPNCIDIRQPADGCQQCYKVGCVSGSRKYEAGHSFQVGRCQVCHCPDEGGRLMCLGVPGCNSRRIAAPENDAPPALENSLPLYKPEPTSSSSLPDPTRPLESTTTPSAQPESGSTASSSHDDLRRSPQSHEDEVTRRADPTATAGAQSKTSPSLTTTAAQRVTTETRAEAPKDPKPGVRSGPSRGTNEEEERRTASPPGEEQQSPYPEVQFSPTSRTPVRMQETTAPGRQPQTLHNYQAGAGEEETGVSAKELVKTCCETGQKWASANGHCNHMKRPAGDRHAMCWTAQQQCCLASLGESQCSAGVAAAQAGSECGEEARDECGIDPYKECCGCCSLGLQFHMEGLRCEAPRLLGSQCRHVFLSCCQGEKTEAGDGWHAVRERPALDPTLAPKRVSDHAYPKEAFSIGEEQEAQNAAEGPDQAVEDMDECAIYEGSICHHTCVNTHGSFRCECFPGFVLQEDAFTCAQETVDEENRLSEVDGAPEKEEEDPTPSLPPPTGPTGPTTPLNPCEGNNICEQQCAPVGSSPQCSCFPGFTLRADGRSCEDINECVQGSHNCGADFDCVNSDGSFRCEPRARCPTGFSRDAQGHCADVDECGALTQPCGAGFNCVNTVGSYVCHRRITCSRGYHSSPDGSRCIDVDECQSGLQQCGEGQMCHNLPGSYRCECQPGYQYDSFRRTCVDVNECWRYPGRLCAQTCENTPGSYQCSCTSGFRLSGDGKNCEDVNECLSSPCGQECANIYGSYQCYCRQGYYLREDGHTCEDIDECAQSVGHLCTYKCVNVAGSYQCACPDHGYTMSPNGRSCRDIDECATGAHNCSLAETCYNIQGGHRCLSLSCPPNYRKVSDTRCERLGCPNYLDCQNSPLRITYYYLSFQSNIVVPAQIFRIGPSPAYAGDNVIVTITRGNEESYFSTRKLNAYTGAVYLHRQVEGPRDFLVTVEMKLWRQGTFTTFQAKIYVFITGGPL